MASKSLCKNCQHPVSGAYCSNCGQRTSVFKVTFGETLADLSSTIFNLEAPIWRTLKASFRNPEVLYTEYLSGRRKHYYKPVPFFILMTVLYLLVKSSIGFDPMRGVTPEQTEGFDATLLVEAGHFMTRNINNILFLFVISLSLMMKLFFWKHHSWAEYMAVAFYMLGVYTIFTIINMVFITYVNPGFQYGAMMAMLLYFIWAMLRFIPEKWYWIVPKALLNFIFALFIYVVLGYGLSFLIVYLRS